MKGKSLLGIAAVAMGLAIAWVDSRPHWDDTGISVGMIFLGCALLGALRPTRAWQWALSIGVWIPLWGVLLSHNYGTFLALIPAFLGAYIGAGVRIVTFPPAAQA